MTKIVRKIRPTNYWRIGEHENWFSDMSLQGLHLHKMGTNLAHFKKGEPKRIEYRIEVTDRKLITYEQIDLYEENGWKYVTSYQWFHVFSSPTEENAPEIHTDPAEQAFTLQRLSKKLVFNLVCFSLGIALILGMLMAMWFLDGTPVLRLVEGYVVQQSILTLVYIHYVFYAIRTILAIKELKESLKEGKAINHHAPWKKSLRKNSAISVVLIGIILLSGLLPFYQLKKMDSYTLPTNDENLPFVRLADIEQNPQLTRDKSYRDEVDWANRYTTNWSIFAPVQFETDENGIIKDEMWLDKSGTYSPSVSTEIYNLTFQAFAKPLLSDLMEWHTYGDERESFIERKHPGFDHLITREDEDWKQLVASKDKVVMYIRYYGYAEMDVIVENAAQKIMLLADS
ncbi:DUF2812 domain-containing protein [Solibacillus isronensis]|uniref:DUF2812 domain-containing protein n=1 Tax=Solibacillus isronensis TaxID=412383 RepID=UPI0009A80C39|nr:DUF2812 domain-containing protein [Solibacillus isronensis]